MVAADCTTETGSRWVTTTVASGNVASRGPSCSRCCGDLSTQRSPRAVLPLQDLEHGLQIGVVRGLVVGQVVVAPARDAGHPLELVAREVGQLELELLVDVVGSHGVHGRQVGQHRPPSLPLLLGPLVAGVGPSGRAARRGRERARSSPTGAANAGGWSAARRLTRWVVPDRGSPTTMIGAVDLDIEDLGMAGEQVADPQTVGGVADAVAEERQCARGRCVGIAVDLRQPQPEPGPEVVGPEVVEAGPLARRRPAPPPPSDRQGGARRGRGPAVWISVSSGLAQVGDADAGARSSSLHREAAVDGEGLAGDVTGRRDWPGRARPGPRRRGCRSGASGCGPGAAR